MSLAFQQGRQSVLFGVMDNMDDLDVEDAVKFGQVSYSSPAERRSMIVDALEKVRPRLQRDGGDIELVEIDGMFVRVRLTGSCVHCAMAGQTLGGVRRELMAVLQEPVRVVPAPLD